MPFVRLLPCILLLLGLVASSRAQSADTSLPAAPPESRGFPGRFFRSFARVAAADIPSLRSFLVWRRDALIYEGYFHGATRDDDYNVKSVSKSVLSAIAGAAYARGYLKSLDLRLVDIFPEYEVSRSLRPDVWMREVQVESDSLRALLTLRHLITMRSGHAWSDSGDVSYAFLTSSDPARFMLDLPFDEAPGDGFNYSTGDAGLFAAALARLVPGDLRVFADTALFAPAHIRLREWPVDPTGRYVGGSEMVFTAIDLLRLGILYLNRGSVDGRQVLPASWIDESMGRQVAIRDRWTIPGLEGYGYYWWLRRSGRHRVACAVGYGGQMICVIPDLGIVVAATCDLEENNRGRSELPHLHALVDRVLRAAGA